MSQPLTLFCLVDGEATSNAFPVSALTKTTIGELKDLIKSKKANDFQDVDSNRLTLWRVSHPVIAANRHNPISLTAIDSPTELDPTDDISDIFAETPPKKTIHIIVQRPAPQVAPSTRLTLPQAFPNGLPYREPEPLLRTTGLDWAYQPDRELFSTLRGSTKDHYHHFSRKRRDKTTTPLYLFLSGAGTGKSRNAQEFHQSAVACLAEDGDEELRNKIEQAWVFHVSLENGTSLLTRETDPMEAVGSRMLHQLLPEKRLEDVVLDYEGVRPMRIFDLVAKATGQDLESAAAFLVVDGIQSFMSDLQDGHDKESTFYKLLTNIADLAIGDIFLMVCCTAIVTIPVDRVLASTHPRRVVLPVASLEPPRITQDDGSSRAVFNEDDHIVRVLVGDCGGHGRALEALSEVLEAAGEDFDVEPLMVRLYDKLRDRYSEVFMLPSSTIQAMARVILSHAHLEPNKPLAGTTSLPGHLAIPGLVQYNQPYGVGSGGHLVAPYIWVWLFSHQQKDGTDPILSNWRFNDYPDLKSKMDLRLPPGALFWQHFEHFVANFRCLKSRVLAEGESTTISEIHTGARLRGDIEFKNHHLQLAISSHHVSTKSTSHSVVSFVRCDNETLHFRTSNHCIINAPSAPSGDSFLRLDARQFCTEVHQYKLLSDGETIDYRAERNKAASNKDFFLLFSSNDQGSVILPEFSGIVDESNWADYFGPFAGRAFIYARTGALNINQARRRDLKSMSGIGDTKADMIIRERDKRRFDSLEDASVRLSGVGKDVLKRFKYV